MKEEIKKDRRCRKTESAVKHALLMLMKHKPISDISISQLAETADINRKTFYNHYADINGVLCDLEDDCLDQVFALLETEKIPEHTKDLYPFLERLSEEFSSNKDLYRLLITSERHTEIERKGNERLKNLICNSLSELNKNPKEYEFFINFITAGIISSYHKFFMDDSTDLDRLTHSLYDIICHLQKYIDA